MERKPLNIAAQCLSVAPMMDWTDRHCRYFHRQLTKSALLYTEMVVADAVIRGDRQRLLSYDDAEHPVALQLGGSDPEKLAEATRIAADFGYDEINLNVGCPSDRVQSGTFGACLMLQPDLVARCIEAMRRAAPDTVRVTVKCRIGVDEQDPEIALFGLARDVIAAGSQAVWVHARKAWLQGLSPRENRDIPPLDYDIVYRLKRVHPDVFIGINGGITDLDQVRDHLTRVDGAMLGRAAYHSPGILAGVDAMMSGGTAAEPDYQRIMEAMAAYADRHVTAGGRVQHVTRHMIGLFQGMPGARRYRQILTVETAKPDCGPDVLFAAMQAVHLEDATAPAA
ncbi:tRNA dihydrouridine(20/20a) synthase DusA [Oricola sp.]|uniref:tRNA dihydrouridine(20/20a) synthase DusA n=1 Tax=Oricola sp. TaxID=1979950 RepID=UPI003BA9A9DE